MSEKKYSNLTDTDILTCLLNPHNLVSTKQTYIRDCFDVRLLEVSFQQLHVHVYCMACMRARHDLYIF